MKTFLIIAAYGELSLWIAAFLLFFLHRDNSFAESAAYAIMTALMMLSLVFQITFILGFPVASLFLEALLTIGAVAVIWRLRKQIKRIWAIFTFVTIRKPLVIFALFAVFAYLAFLSCTSVPSTGHQDLFKKMNFFSQYGTFFLPPHTGANDGLLPVNILVLAHLFLRADSQMGIGLFGFLAYVSIGFSTYALSRRYAWPDTAFTVTFITLSLPRLVFLSTTPGEEIIAAAVSLFCILAIYRALEHPDIQDLILLVSGIFFSISGNFLCLAFPVILIVLSCILFIRRHGTVTWTSMVIDHWKISLAALLPVFVFSQIWLFAFNIVEYGGWLGSNSLPSGMAFKDNVLLGALANLVRYFFEIIHVTPPLDMIFQRALGFSYNGLLIKAYDVMFVPLFGEVGAAVPFVLTTEPDGKLSWFGPFGIFLVIPSIVLAIFRSHRRLKAIAVALAGYVYLIALVMAWQPGNAQFFTIVFTCGGFCVSFLLPPWRFSTTGKKCLQVISIVLLIYVCLFNVDRPFFTLPELSRKLSDIQDLDNGNADPILSALIRH